MSVSLAAVLQLRAESMLVTVSLLRGSLATDKSLFIPEPGGGVKVICGGWGDGIFPEFAFSIAFRSCK
jgi:hypothetical protein